MTASDPLAALLLDEVDWKAPWLEPLAAAGQRVVARVAAGAGVHEALGTGSEKSFVASDALPRGEAYEAFIARTGNVPTRSNLHDFFNALIWQHYPLTKSQLNRLQAGALAQQGVGPVRGPLRDACTLFDENGAVLQAPAALWQALLVRDWQALFVTHRALWREARLSILGHAALEQLVQPRKGLTVHVLAVSCPVPVAPDALKNIAAVDHWLCAELDVDLMRRKPFTPLPVLGIPGWWQANAALSFYDDLAVFRPRRVPTKP